jgi:Family of unknown function (DUF6356)
MLRQIFIEHPASVDETYFQHLRFAVNFSVLLLAAGAAALVHALIPCLFEKTAGNIVRKLYQAIANRG